MPTSEPAKRELILPLPDGRTLRCGEGENYPWGDYVRICATDGTEIHYWDKQEWQDDPEQVMGAIFQRAVGWRG